jgi:hypothetical protein
VDRWPHTAESRFSSLWNRFAVPFKHHAEHRHHIPKPRYRVTNWAEYGASLRPRGSLTVWFTDEAIQAWRAEPRTTPGGKPHYSALAISTALTMGVVFGLALRQTEGLIGSVIGLLGLDLAVPDHSTLSRRAKTLEVPHLRRAGTGRPEARRSRRMAGRKARNVPSPILAEAAYRRRCRQRRDCRRHGDPEGYRRCRDG